MERLLSRLRMNGWAKDGSSIEKVTFVMRKFSEWFPFENVDVLTKNNAEISPAYLISKMIVGGRGGLCYEINPLLYLTLKELGFDVFLSAATIYNKEDWAIDRTHAIVLLRINGQLFLADSGMGNRIPLAPVPLDQQEVRSPAGSFRLRTLHSEKGSVALEMLNSENQWVLRYAFHPETLPWEELNRMKRDIHTQERSPFNKQLLIANVLRDGTQSINEERLHRRWMDGREETIAFPDHNLLLQAIQTHYSPALAEAVKSYLS